jgi:TolA-binding protein
MERANEEELAEGGSMDGLRHDGPERVLFLEQLEFTPTIGKAVLRPYPKTAGSMTKPLGKITYEGPQSWTEVGRCWGTREYGVTVQDFENGPDSPFNIRKHARIVCEGFGPPRNLAAPASPTTYAAEPARVESAPREPREANMNAGPSMVQTPQEALLSSLQAGRQDPLGPVVMFLLQQMAQGQGQQSNDLRDVVRRLEAKIDELSGEVKHLRQESAQQKERQATEAARNARTEEMLTRLAKELEGVPLHNVDQVKGLIQRLGPEVFGLGGDPEERQSRWAELLGPLFAQLGPALAPMVAALLGRMVSVLTAGAALQAPIEMGAGAEAEPPVPEPEPPAARSRPPQPAGPASRPPARYVPPTFGNGHAGPDPADTGT